MVSTLWNKSVFRWATPEEKVSPVSLMILMFHRSSAVMYFALSLWGVVSLMVGLSSMSIVWGEDFQVIYSTLIAIVGLSASFAASFFPILARYELFISSMLLSLMGLYTYTLLYLDFTTDLSWLPLTFFSLTPFIFPLSRVIFIYKTMVAQATKGA